MSYVYDVKYKEFHPGFGAMMVSKGVHVSTQVVAGMMKAEMISRSPRSGDGEGVPYAESFRVERRNRIVPLGKYQALRSSTRIINTAPHAPALEFGKFTASDKRKPRRIMFKSGLKFGNPSLGKMVDA